MGSLLPHVDHEGGRVEGVASGAGPGDRNDVLAECEHVSHQQEQVTVHVVGHGEAGAGGFQSDVRIGDRHGLVTVAGEVHEPTRAVEVGAAIHSKTGDRDDGVGHGVRCLFAEAEADGVNHSGLDVHSYRSRSRPAFGSLDYDGPHAWSQVTEVTGQCGCSINGLRDLADHEIV